MTGRTADVPLDDCCAARLVLPAGGPIDPWTLAGDDGLVVASPERVLVGIGTAALLPLPDGLADPGGLSAVGSALAAVPRTDALAGAGCGDPVIAFGALPFERTTATHLTVCTLTYGRESDGTEWAAVVGPRRMVAAMTADPAALRADLAAGGPAVHGRAPSHEVPAALDGGPRDGIPGLDDEAFRRAVRAVLAQIGEGRLTKAVVARHVDIDLADPVDAPGLLGRWRELEPTCTLLAMPTPQGRLLAASPELLVARTGDRVESTPLAGTTDRHHDPASSLPVELWSSVKDTAEHRLVVDAIAETLGSCTDVLDVPPVPQLVTLRTVAHLATPIQGTLAAGPGGRLPSVLDLVGALHPTPAVGGVPREAALACIADLEAAPRGPYAGPVGYVDGAGDGRWMVGIRAVLAAGRRARLSAGVGVVAGSVPETELAEVDLKLRSVAEVLDPSGALLLAAGRAAVPAG